MKALDELLNRTDPAWAVIEPWFAAAKNHAEVLPPIDDVALAAPQIESIILFIQTLR